MKYVVISRGEGKKAFEDMIRFSQPNADIVHMDIGKDDTALTLHDRCDEIVAQEADCIFTNGTMPKTMVDTLRGLGQPVFGVGQQDGRFEAFRTFTKHVVRGFGIPQSDFREFKSFYDFMEHSKHVKYPCYMKHDSGQVGMTAFVHNADEVAFMYKALNYRHGFTLESPIEGVEVSFNYLINRTGYVWIGANHDVKDGLGGVTGNVYTNVLKYDIYEDQIRPLLSFMVQTGYRGPMAITGIVRDGAFHVIEVNTRFGFSSTYMYLNGLNNALTLCKAVALNTPLPKPVFRFSHGLTAAVRSHMARETYDMPVHFGGRVVGVTLVENDIEDGMTNGGVPALLVSMGSIAVHVELALRDAACRVQLPFKSVEVPLFMRFERLHREGGYKS